MHVVPVRLLLPEEAQAESQVSCDGSGCPRCSTRNLRTVAKGDPQGAGAFRLRQARDPRPRGPQMPAGSGLARGGALGQARTAPSGPQARATRAGSLTDYGMMRALEDEGAGTSRPPPPMPTDRAGPRPAPPPPPPHLPLRLPTLGSSKSRLGAGRAWARLAQATPRPPLPRPSHSGRCSLRVGPGPGPAPPLTTPLKQNGNAMAECSVITHHGIRVSLAPRLRTSAEAPSRLSALELGIKSEDASVLAVVPGPAGAHRPARQE